MFFKSHSLTDAQHEKKTGNRIEVMTGRKKNQNQLIPLGIDLEDMPTNSNKNLNTVTLLKIGRTI